MKNEKKTTQNPSDKLVIDREVEKKLKKLKVKADIKAGLTRRYSVYQ